MTRLRVHQRSLTNGAGATGVELLVQCPAARRSVSVEACGRCGHGRGECLNETLEAGVIECERAPERADTDGFDSHIHVVPAIALATRDVLCVTPDARVEDVRRLLIDQRIGCVPVIGSSGRPVGIVTAFDLLQNPAARYARDAMTSPTASIREMTSVMRAAAIMAFEGIHHLPVVNEAGEIVALLSSTDVLRHIGREQGFLVPGETHRQRTRED